MAIKCDLCSKTLRFGNRISHSKQHTRRKWLPNIQPTTFNINGTAIRLNLCTRCIRTRNKVSH
ncbi:MAG: 50S ribosomal protein L28 [Chloroflexi bacterium]|nr:50S ribosomal protein L28 [Chloroflexota bacterium]